MGMQLCRNRMQIEIRDGQRVKNFQSGAEIGMTTRESGQSLVDHPNVSLTQTRVEEFEIVWMIVISA